MIKSRNYLYLVYVIYFLINVSCISLNKRHNPSETDIYLQSINSNNNLEDNYGYVKSNPIILKLSSKLNNELIIEEFIKRLWKNGKGASYGTLQSFEIIEKSKFIDINDQIESESKWIYSYTIRSTDKTEIVELFFKLKHRTNKLYSPKGFGYSINCGEWNK